MLKRVTNIAPPPLKKIKVTRFEDLSPEDQQQETQSIIKKSQLIARTKAFPNWFRWLKLLLIKIDAEAILPDNEETPSRIIDELFVKVFQHCIRIPEFKIPQGANSTRILELLKRFSRDESMPPEETIIQIQRMKLITGIAVDAEQAKQFCVTIEGSINHYISQCQDEGLKIDEQDMIILFVKSLSFTSPYRNFVPIALRVWSENKSLASTMEIIHLILEDFIKWVNINNGLRAPPIEFVEPAY
ncbi:hypothetical protein WICMUC_002129 [Wickerhamomyces mucosus]|uniref:Uncharacterized protein n=1 Tax=Wickerhamomyces mucosus TaxID=1378264 RepID=A0A9P8PQJ7_9ASCO|nr:hypothetical protein WICMUC_002129 [Wickerhamomyces mucosus]